MDLFNQIMDWNIKQGDLDYDAAHEKEILLTKYQEFYSAETNLERLQILSDLTLLIESNLFKASLNNIPFVLFHAYTKLLEEAKQDFLRVTKLEQAKLEELINQRIYRTLRKERLTWYKRLKIFILNKYEERIFKNA